MAGRAPETFDERADGKQVVSLAADVFMFGGFILEVVTGKDPWWFMSDGDLHNTRYPPKEGEIRSTPYRRDANPLDDAKAAGRLVYLVNDPPLIAKLEDLMHRCFSSDPAARPSMDAILSELTRLRDGEGAARSIRVDRHYIQDVKPPAVQPVRPPSAAGGAGHPLPTVSVRLTLK